MKQLGYFVTAALLGAGWFVVLLIPPWTREWLLLGDRRLIGWHIAFLALASVLVAWIFRSYIGRASRIGQHFKRALLLPYVGCFIYLTLWTVLTFIQDLVHRSPHQVHDTLILIPWGLVSALAACFVVIPYGLVCQFGMKSALDE